MRRERLQNLLKFNDVPQRAFTERIRAKRKPRARRVVAPADAGPADAAPADAASADAGPADAENKQRAAFAKRRARKPISDTNHDTYLTPKALLEAIVREWGEIDLDAAASATNTCAPRFFTKEMNALLQPWCKPDGQPSRVFVNPPYGKDESGAGISEWIDKALQAVAAGHASQVTMFIPCYADVKWYRKVLARAAEIVFIEGRVRFEGPNVKGRGTCPNPSMLVVFKPGHEGRPRLGTLSRFGGSVTWHSA